MTETSEINSVTGFMDATITNVINGLNVNDIKELGAIKYENSAAFGSKSGSETIVINTKK